jgi:hypothetical protein
MERMTLSELREAIHSVRNACDIAFLLMAEKRLDLLPTILEYAAMDIQSIMLDYCAQEAVHPLPPELWTDAVQ